MRLVLCAAVAAAASVDSGSAEDSELVDWVRREHGKGGYEWAPVSVAVFDGMRGLRADRDVGVGETAVAVPERLLLSRDRCKDAEKVALAAKADVDDATMLAVQLAVESRRMSSFWQEWIAALPSAFPDLPFYWPDAAWDALQRGYPSYSTLSDKIAWRHKNPKHRQLRAALQKEIGAGSDDAFHWAVSAVGSRAYGSPPRLVPLLDMANHRRGAPSVHVARKTSDAAARVTATKPIKKGDEVFVSYGEAGDAERHCSLDQLVHYGVLFDGGDAKAVRGAYDCAEMRIPLPQKGVQADIVKKLAAKAPQHAQVGGGVLRVQLTKGQPVPPILPVVYVMLYGNDADMAAVAKGINSADGDPLSQIAGGRAVARLVQDLTVMKEARETAPETDALWGELETAGMLPSSISHLRSVQRGELRVLRAALKRVHSGAPASAKEDDEL